MKVIKKEYHIWAPLSKVWDALVNPKTIDKWSQLDSSSEHPTGSREVLQKEATSLGGAGFSIMSDKVGSKFSLWGGDIWGKNVKVSPKKELVQEWYGGDWHKPSIAIFKLIYKDGCTTLFLTHEGVPEKEVDSFDKGWDDSYLAPIKELLEK